jgi:hypothetical protein
MLQNFFLSLLTLQNSIVTRKPFQLILMFVSEATCDCYSGAP